MRHATKHHAGLWGAVAITSLLVLGVAVFAATTREEPPIASVQVTDDLSLDLVAVLTQKQPRHDLSTFGRRMLWKLPRSLRSMVYAFGKPANPQLVRAVNMGPDDVELIFVAKGNEAGISEDKVMWEMARAGLGPVRLNYGDDRFSTETHLSQRPPRGRKVLRSVKFAGVPPITTGPLVLEFLQSTGKAMTGNWVGGEPPASTATDNARVVHRIELGNALKLAL